MDFDIQQIVLDVLRNLVDVTLEQVPRIVTALVVILIGVIIAKVIERILRLLLTRLHFDKLLERIGLTAALGRLGMKQSPSRAISRLIYLLLVVLFVQSATVSVGLTTIADAIGSFFAYLPNLISAVVIALLGSIIAQFAGTTVSQAAAESGVDFAPALGRMVAAVVMFVVGLMAISQLKIDTNIIHTFVIVLLASVGLSMALSFGLGSRDVTRSIVTGFYLRKTLDIGREIEVEGMKGTLVAITPTSTVVEADGETMAIANDRVAHALVKQRDAQS